MRGKVSDDVHLVSGLNVFDDLLFPISDTQSKSGEEGILGLILEYLPSIAITIGNFVVPLLCDQFALIERYTPSTTVIVALLRLRGFCGSYFVRAFAFSHLCL